MAAQSAACAHTIGDREIRSLALHGKAWAHRHLGQLPASFACAGEAVAIARDLHAPLTLAYALTHLAEAQMLLATTAQEWAESAGNFQETQTIFSASNKTVMADESAIGLAELARRSADLPEAYRLIAAILPGLPTTAAEGWDEPVRAFVVCVQILRACHDPRAEPLLAQGLQFLDVLSQTIGDPRLRQQFIEAIPAHQQLRSLILITPHKLQLATITVVFFVEAVDDENRTRYETPYHDAATGVMVEPALVTTVE